LAQRLSGDDFGAPDIVMCNTFRFIVSEQLVKVSSAQQQR
jgi:hypothetical protein